MIVITSTWNCLTRTGSIWICSMRACNMTSTSLSTSERCEISSQAKSMIHIYKWVDQRKACVNTFNLWQRPHETWKMRGEVSWVHSPLFLYKYYGGDDDDIIKTTHTIPWAQTPSIECVRKKNYCTIFSATVISWFWLWRSVDSVWNGIGFSRIRTWSLDAISVLSSSFFCYDKYFFNIFINIYEHI